MNVHRYGYDLAPFGWKIAAFGKNISLSRPYTWPWNEISTYWKPHVNLSWIYGRWLGIWALLLYFGRRKHLCGCFDSSLVITRKSKSHAFASLTNNHSLMNLSKNYSVTEFPFVHHEPETGLLTIPHGNKTQTNGPLVWSSDTPNLCKNNITNYVHSNIIKEHEQLNQWSHKRISVQFKKFTMG